MAKRQGLDDIIRDVISKMGTGPTKRKMRMKPFVGDIASDPLGSIKGPRRKYNPKQKVSPNVSEKAANKGKLVAVPRPKGDRRMYARAKRVYGSGQKGGMR